MKATLSPPANEVQPITEGEFALLKDLIYRESGIHLGSSKTSLLTARLGRRLRELGLTSFGDYYRYIVGGADAHELVTMLDRITTNETHFFREGHQFDYLETSVFPEWRRAGDRSARPKRLTAWSAACATGEEAYSLAMSLLWHFPADEGWSVQVRGTDISTQALGVARQATWPIERAKAIPHRYLRRYMLRGTRSQEGRMQARDELRDVVRLDRVNLNAERYPLSGPFDLILARNVFIYFAEPARTAALKRIAAQLAPGGYLLLGHAESPGKALQELEPVKTMIFRAPQAAANDRRLS